MNILIELHYLPGIQYMSKFSLFDHVIVDDTETFKKQSYRNRCSIAGANGIIDLIIPVHDSRKGLPVKEIKIDNHTSWYRQHWQSIRSAYGKTPFFEHYCPYLEPAFTKPSEFLFDLNLELLHILLKILKVNPSKLKLYSDSADAEFIDFRNKIHPKERFQVEDPVFKPIPYQQAFQEKHGFIPDLSVIDWIFNQGNILGR